MARELPIQDFADSIGRSRQFVDQKLLKTGKIKYRKNKKGRILVDLDSADEYYGRKPEGTTRQRAGESILEQALKGADTTNGDTPSDLSQLAKIELALKMAKYETQRLKNEKTKSNLIDFKDIARERSETARILKENLERLPKLLADKCHGKSKHDIEQTARKEIKSMLFSITGEDENR